MAGVRCGRPQLRSGNESPGGGSAMVPECKSNADGMEGSHAATIRRMIENAPPFRPDATPYELVAEFANVQNRMAAFLALYSRGKEAVPAIRAGLRHSN